jgi:hypothetical protein
MTIFKFDGILIEEPKYVGSMPIRSELAILPAPIGPSLGELEFAEHGSIALRVLVGVDSPIEDNTIDDSWTLARHGIVLVRGKKGGFFMTPLEHDSRGWVVYVGEPGGTVQELRVEFDTTRERWVVRTLPG